MISRGGLLFGILFLALVPSTVVARQPVKGSLPFRLTKNFDYAEFTRFDAAAPPKEGIYQSNGFLALVEDGFGGQTVIVPAPVDEAPGNISDRLPAMEIEPPVFVDSSNRSYDLTASPAKRHVTYHADRTVYRAVFDGGPEVSLTVYPIYGRSAAVIRMRVERSDGALHLTIPPEQGLWCADRLYDPLRKSARCRAIRLKSLALSFVGRGASECKA